MAKETNRKISVNWNVSETQQDQVNVLEKKFLINQPSNVIRKNAEIVLAENVSVPSMEKFVISHTFENLPEWTIPHFRLKYFFNTEDGYIFDDLAIVSVNVYSIWSQIDTNYIFSFVIGNSIISTDGSNIISLFLTASLIFDNPRIFNELQFNKA